MASSNSSGTSTPIDLLNRALYDTPPHRNGGSVLEEISSSHVFAADMSAQVASSLVPDLFTQFPSLFDDEITTETSKDEVRTIKECMPFLSGMEASMSYNSHVVPHLDRKRHIRFLENALGDLPGGFARADASRPWMFYWALNGLVAMGQDVSKYKERLIATAVPIQNATGGFGGGNGQTSHIAPTYAMVLSLVLVGGKEALDFIDRRAMWKWLGQIKNEDGGFRMCVGGETDVRGCLCASVVISLLDIPLELPRDSPAWVGEGSTFWTGLGEYIGRCQTYEGGIAGSPDLEAHGGYAFCALAALCIMEPPHVVLPKYLDVPRLISFISARQYAPEGGLSGRTNKLVDGCYAHWVGVCWPLIEACLDGQAAEAGTTATVSSLYSQEGLIRYILCCCQDKSKRGGLRDKPSHNSDSYHTCYVLSGLSSTQHKWRYNKKADTSGLLNTPFRWSSEPIVEADQIYDEVDRVEPIHPVFVIPAEAAEKTREYFAAKGGF